MRRNRTLYVANIGQRVRRDELRQLFARHGVVCASEVILADSAEDHGGAAFVEVDSREHGEAAIAALNGTRHGGSALLVGWIDRILPPRRRSI